MIGLAGRLRQRVTILRATGARDAIGGDMGTPAIVASAWAAIAPRGGQPLAEGDARAALPLWAVTLRRRDLRVGDILEWGTATVIVRSVIVDPAAPDRIEAIAEEQR